MGKAVPNPHKCACGSKKFHAKYGSIFAGGKDAIQKMYCSRCGKAHPDTAGRR